MNEAINNPVSTHSEEIKKYYEIEKLKAEISQLKRAGYKRLAFWHLVATLIGIIIGGVIGFMNKNNISDKQEKIINNTQYNTEQNIHKGQFDDQIKLLNEVSQRTELLEKKISKLSIRKPQIDVQDKFVDVALINKGDQPAIYEESYKQWRPLMNNWQLKPKCKILKSVPISLKQQNYEVIVTDENKSILSKYALGNPMLSNVAGLPVARLFSMGIELKL